MFLESSRYARARRDEVKTLDGRAITIVRLRRLPDVEGRPTTVRECDRLDILAQQAYDDPTRFWHIADANSELRARALDSTPGRAITVPET